MRQPNIPALFRASALLEIALLFYHKSYYSEISVLPSDIIGIVESGGTIAPAHRGGPTAVKGLRARVESSLYSAVGVLHSWGQRFVNMFLTD